MMIYLNMVILLVIAKMLKKYQKIINLPLDISRKQVEYISNKFINICVNLEILNI